MGIQEHVWPPTQAISHDIKEETEGMEYESSAYQSSCMTQLIGPGLAISW